MSQSRLKKTLKFKEHLQIYLYLPFFKTSSRARTQTSKVQSISFYHWTLKFISLYTSIK